MAHFVELDANDNVINIVVVDNKILLDETNVENEQKGIDYLKSLLGEHRIWVQTSYNGKFRKRHAGVGHTYNRDLDVFLEPKPYDSWVLDDNASWVPPVAYPVDDENHLYDWDEETVSWKAIS